MKNSHNKHEGDLTLTVDLELHGMVVGNLTVPFHKTLILHGLVTGDLIVEPFGTAIVHGTVSGEVRNRGGDVCIFGIVGAIVDIGPTKSAIDANAIVQKSN